MRRRNYFTYTFQRRTILFGVALSAAYGGMITGLLVKHWVNPALVLLTVYLTFCGLFLLINFLKWIHYKKFK